MLFYIFFVLCAQFLGQFFRKMLHIRVVYWHMHSVCLHKCNSAFLPCLIWFLLDLKWKCLSHHLHLWVQICIHLQTMGKFSWTLCYMKSYIQSIHLSVQMYVMKCSFSMQCRLIAGVPVKALLHLTGTQLGMLLCSLHGYERPMRPWEWCRKPFGKDLCRGNA